MVWLGKFSVLSIIIFSLDLSRSQITTPYGETEMDCPPHNTKLMVNEVNWAVPYRAYLTAPPYMRIATASIPGSGLGVFTDIFIKKYTWLVYYEGDLVPIEQESDVGVYAWSVRRDETRLGLFDANPVERSNYLRFINMPNNQKDENIMVMECYTRIYYMTMKDLVPGMELFVYYGDSYAHSVLELDLNNYFNVPEKWIEVGMDLNTAKCRDELYDARIRFFDLQQHEPHDYPHILEACNKTQ